jgi:hypothetical protein
MPFLESAFLHVGQTHEKSCRCRSVLVWFLFFLLSGRLAPAGSHGLEREQQHGESGVSSLLLLPRIKSSQLPAGAGGFLLCVSVSFHLSWDLTGSWGISLAPRSCVERTAGGGRDAEQLGQGAAPALLHLHPPPPPGPSLEAIRHGKSTPLHFPLLSLFQFGSEFPVSFVLGCLVHGVSKNYCQTQLGIQTLLLLLTRGHRLWIVYLSAAILLALKKNPSI